MSGLEIELSNEVCKGGELALITNEVGHFESVLNAVFKLICYFFAHDRQDLRFFVFN